MRFEVPPHAQVERELGRGAPVVLQVGTDLGIVGLQERIATLPDDLKRRAIIESELPAPVDRIRIEELGCHPVLLVDIVIQEVDVPAGFQHVVPTGMPTGIRDVVTQPQPTLREVLRAEVAPDGDAASEIEPSLGDTRRVRRRIASEPLIRHGRFAQPRPSKIVVLERPDGNVVPVVDG